MSEITLMATVRDKAICAARSPGYQECPYPDWSEHARVWKQWYTDTVYRDAQIRQQRIARDNLYYGEVRA